MLLCLQSGTIHLQGLGSAKIDFLIQQSCHVCQCHSKHWFCFHNFFRNHRYYALTLKMFIVSGNSKVLKSTWLGIFSTWCKNRLRI